MYVNRMIIGWPDRSVILLATLLLSAGALAATPDAATVPGVSSVEPNDQNTASSMRAAESLFRSSVPENARPWTFDQIASRALLEHPAILSRRSSAEAAHADVDAAEWQRFPTPSLSANNDTKGQGNTMVSLQQPLWAGGRITSGISGAEARYGASTQSIRETEENVLIAIVNAFAEATRWQAHQAISAENLRQHTKLYEMIGRRVRAEASPAIDLELAQGRLYQAKAELSYAGQMLQNSISQLSQLVGSPVSSVVPLRSELFAQIESRESSIGKAQTRSPVLARLAHETDAAEAEVGIKKSVYWPQLSIRYEKQKGPTVFNVDRLMLTADMQFGAGFSAVSNAGAARARLDAARQERARAARDLVHQVSVDWSDYVAARARVDNASRASSISGAVFDSYTRQYTASRKSWLDVLNAVREESQSKGMVVDAFAQMTGAGMRLLVRTGKVGSTPAGQPLRQE